MELYYKFTIKLIQSKLNPCDVGYGKPFLKPGASSSKLPNVNLILNLFQSDVDLM